MHAVVSEGLALKSNAPFLTISTNNRGFGKIHRNKSLQSRTEKSTSFQHKK